MSRYYRPMFEQGSWEWADYFLNRSGACHHSRRHGSNTTAGIKTGKTRGDFWYGPMTLYQPTSVTWPEPFESTWQLLGGTYAHDLAPKLPHSGLNDILFMTTIMSLPREQRPWGIATWMTDVFLLSRTALYELTKRVQHDCRQQQTRSLYPRPRNKRQL